MISLSLYPGVPPHEAQDLVEDARDDPAVRADDGDPERPALPQILVIDFGHRDFEAALEPLLQALHDAALLLERARPGHDELDAQNPDLHGAHLGQRRQQG